MQRIEDYKTDSQGKFSFKLHEAGTYFLFFAKKEGTIFYAASEKIDFLINPRPYFSASNGVYNLCFREPIGSITIIEGEKRTTQSLDENNCTQYSPKTESFTVETPYSKEFKKISIPVKVETEKPTPVPTQPTPIQTQFEEKTKPISQPKTQTQPDLLLPISILLVASICLVAAGVYLRKRRMNS
ncbi:MAG: hypothetical protein QXK06_00405 [Candidatus Diapherotrites archaeon]